MKSQYQTHFQEEKKCLKEGLIIAENAEFFKTIFEFLAQSMSADDEIWIKQHRIDFDMWRIFFIERNGGWKRRELSLKIAKIMSRDILDAKNNRTSKSPFSKNPHLAQLSSILQLNMAGKKLSEAIIKETIIESIKSKNK